MCAHWHVYIAEEEVARVVMMRSTFHSAAPVSLGTAIMLLAIYKRAVCEALVYIPDSL